MEDIFLWKRELISKTQALDKKEEDLELSYEECDQWSLLKSHLVEFIS